MFVHCEGTDNLTYVIEWALLLTKDAWVGFKIEKKMFLTSEWQKLAQRVLICGKSCAYFVF